MKAAMFLILSVVLLISGCVGFDMSLMETAVPLKPGKFAIQGSANKGGNLADSEASDDFGFLKAVEEAGYFTAKAKMGLPANSEVGMVAIMNYQQNGGRVFAKKSLSSNYAGATAIMPAFTYMVIRDKISEEEGHSYSPELNVLKSIIVDESAILTFGFRTALNLVEYDDKYDGEEETSFASTQIGVRANMRMGLGNVYFMPELGADLFPSGFGNAKYLITGSLGVGIN